MAFPFIVTILGIAKGMPVGIREEVAATRPRRTRAEM
jgi:hypothetical protein